MNKIALFAFLVTSILCSCTKKVVEILPTRHVDTIVIQSMDVPYTFGYPATVQGVADFQVIPRVSGTILKQLYKEGSFVKAGQPLYEIDPRPYQTQLAAHEGQLLKDNSALIEYKKILDRNIQLLKIGGVSQQDVDTANINYKNALGQVAIDKAEIENDKLNIRYCMVEAPVNGLISERLVTIGATVTAYQTILTNINSSTDLYINFSVPENDRLELQKGITSNEISIPKDYKFTVSLRLADGFLIESAGTVDFFDTRISLNNGTWSMRANIDNKKIGNQLLSGQFVHITLNGAKFKNAIIIPQSSVFRDNEGSFVYIIGNSGVIEKRPINTGMMLNQLWVINSGLKNGDKVVTDGGMKVMVGESVIVDNVIKQSDQGADLINP